MGRASSPPCAHPLPPATQASKLPFRKAPVRNNCNFFMFFCILRWSISYVAILTERKSSKVMLEKKVSLYHEYYWPSVTQAPLTRKKTNLCAEIWQASMIWDLSIVYSLVLLTIAQMLNEQFGCGSCYNKFRKQNYWTWLGPKKLLFFKKQKTRLW